MGYGDPDHHHPLIHHYQLKEDAVCFRCELPISHSDAYYGCTRCNHFVHTMCLDLPDNMRHPHHPQHSLTLLPSPIISTSTSQTITDNCNQCLEPFVGGYAYHCQSCLNFNLHLKCFLTLNLETKHNHPLGLLEWYIEHIHPFSLFEWFGENKDCRICGLLIDYSDRYSFACVECKFFIHFECTFIPPTVNHRHVHELTFEDNYPEGSKIFDCDVCLGEEEGKELDRTLSYYYCEKCDYIAHERCVTSQPAKVIIPFDHFIHEHPMLLSRIHHYSRCDACELRNQVDLLYFCNICGYKIHKSCAEYPRFIKHPRHEENHTLSLQSCASQNKDCKLVCCEFCANELEGRGWIFQCSDCDFSVHFSCARKFEHPLYKVIHTFISYKEKNFRCNACGELGGGFRMSNRDEDDIDLHVECFSLPGQIERGCHSHPLYLVNSPTEIELDLPTVFQCDICHTEADPEFWVYCCIQCKYIAHLKCVVSNLLPAPGLPCIDFSNICSIEKEKFKVRKTKLVDCSKLVDYSEMLHDFYEETPLFLPRGFFFDRKKIIGDNNDRFIESDVADSHKSFTHVLCCPKCQKPIFTQANSSVWDWVHHNLKPSIYKIQNETPADNESLPLLDENIVHDLNCPICNLSIFPPTYSCADCQIFFHKSCAELPQKYTVDGGHTLVLQSPCINNNSLRDCGRCKHPCKGYAYFCTSCEIGFDVICALGAPLLKLKNHKHGLFAQMTSLEGYCDACHQGLTGQNLYFRCGTDSCYFVLHIECALLPHVVKHRIHQHPLVLEPYLDLSVDDYICDICEKKLNPCIWVYRCSDSCGDRATSHVSCIVKSNKKCHFVYDEECTYPHLDKSNWEQQVGDCRYTFPKRKMMVPALAAAIVNEPPWKQQSLLSENLFLFVDELEHEYGKLVTDFLMSMGQAEVFCLMESPDALRAKVVELVKDRIQVDKEQNAENDEYHYKSPRQVYFNRMHYSNKSILRLFIFNFGFLEYFVLFLIFFPFIYKSVFMQKNLFFLVFNFLSFHLQVCFRAFLRVYKIVLVQGVKLFWYKLSVSLINLCHPMKQLFF